jgi:DNA polymerase (family 10)
MKKDGGKKNISKTASEKNLNEELAKILFKIADIYEIKQIKWKPQAYRIAGQTIESLKQDIKEIYQKEGEKGVDNLPGIGEGITKKIIQFIETGKIEEYEKLKRELPTGVSAMMDLEGIGAKKALILYNKLGIKNIQQLEEAGRQHKISKLPGFKEKSEEKILESIFLSKEKQNKIPLKEAEKIAGKIISELEKLPEVETVIVAGSVRRKKSLIRDLDIIVKTSKPKEVIDKFSKMKFVKRIIGKGLKKTTISTKENIQVDMRVTDDNSFGACLLYFTGDKQHNIWLRKIAIKKNLKLNEYGLFKDGKKIAGKTEEEIYKKLGIKILPPEKRIGEPSVPH